MTMLSFAFWLIVLAVLIRYLSVSVGLRYRVGEAARRVREQQLPGTAFDVSTIAPQIERVRHDYLAAPQFQSRPSFDQSALVAAARRIVTNLPYFRREEQGASAANTPGR